MLGFATYAALLPGRRVEWALSNVQAGVVGGMFFAGYVATVSYWTALTDRHDGRKVYLAGSLLAAAGSAGFGWLAEGFAGGVFDVSVEAFDGVAQGGVAGVPGGGAVGQVLPVAGAGVGGDGDRGLPADLRRVVGRGQDFWPPVAWG